MAMKPRPVEVSWNWLGLGSDAGVQETSLEPWKNFSLCRYRCRCWEYFFRAAGSTKKGKPTSRVRLLVLEPFFFRAVSERFLVLGDMTLSRRFPDDINNSHTISILVMG